MAFPPLVALLLSTLVFRPQTWLVEAFLFLQHQPDSLQDHRKASPVAFQIPQTSTLDMEALGHHLVLPCRKASPSLRLLDSLHLLVLQGRHLLLLVLRRPRVLRLLLDSLVGEGTFNDKIYGMWIKFTN